MTAARVIVTCLALLWAVVGPAAAHTGGTTGFAKITAQGQTVRYSLSLSTETLAASGLAAASSRAQDYDALAGLVTAKVAITADGRACAPVPGAVTPPTPDRSNAVIVVHYACAGPVRELTVRDNLFDTLGKDYHTLASFERQDGASEQFIFQPDQRETRMRMAEGAQPVSAAGGVLAFIGLGIEHILLGFDHVLFVVALMLRGGRFARLIAIVTAFTVAHSVTLALSVLDVVSLPARFVEPVIALSIAYVALENILPGERQVSRRWLVSFLFGLVHGFGFAGALAELELPKQGLALSLIGFNLGVELGQTLVIALLLPPLLWLQRFPWQRRAVTAASVLLMLAGLSLLVDRLFLSGT